MQLQFQSLPMYKESTKTVAASKAQKCGSEGNSSVGWTTKKDSRLALLYKYFIKGADLC